MCPVARIYTPLVEMLCPLQRKHMLCWEETSLVQTTGPFKNTAPHPAQAGPFALASQTDRFFTQSLGYVEAQNMKPGESDALASCNVKC